MEVGMAEAPQITPLVVRDGNPQGNPSPFYTTFSGKGSQDSVQFHLLIESSATEAEALCQLALGSFQKSFTSGGRASLTTVLGDAFQTCHKDLEAANAPHDMASRVGVGVTCLAMRGDEAYLAVVGDSVIYLRDRHGVTKITPAVQGTSSPVLGTSSDPIEVTMARPGLNPGESLLVASGSLEDAAGYDALENIMATSPQAAVEKLAIMMGEDPLFLAIILNAPTS
jgi:serine/threonine protein phosphatase PrpC